MCLELEAQLEACMYLVPLQEVQQLLSYFGQGGRYTLHLQEEAWRLLGDD